MSERPSSGRFAHRWEVEIDELERGDGPDDDDAGGVDVGGGETSEGPASDHLCVGGGRLDGARGGCRGRPARARGIWTNAAAQPVDCEFILPAIARRGRVSVAVSTDGASPALARELRNVIDEFLTDGIGALAEMLAADRSAVQANDASTEDVDWTERVRRGISEALAGRSLAP